MPDVVGVVQPKLREAEKSELKRPTNLLPGSPKNAWCQVPQQVKVVVCIFVQIVLVTFYLNACAMWE